MTRVKPSMLPPTIITAPTSATARPKAVSAIINTAKRSCSSISRADKNGPAPSERSWSPPLRRASITNRRESAAMSGTTNTVCAITMAVGVKSKPHSPSGPERDSNKYTSKPTTTEGKASKVLTNHTSNAWPGQRATAKPAPKLRPKTMPMRQALALT